MPDAKKEEKKLEKLEKKVEQKEKEVKKQEAQLDKQEKAIEKKEKEVEKKIKEVEKKVEQVKKLSLGRKIGRTNLSSAKAFKKEMQKSTVTAIVAAFGFLIALAWRDAITEYINRVAQASPLQNAFVTAIIITFIAVIGIMIITRIFSTEDKK